jgi:predicted nucleic acid-binding protein
LISLGEYHYGISQSREKDELAAWLDAFLDRAEVLTPTLSTLPHYADIRRELKLAGTPIPANDCWIAALVREYKMPIVSKDGHFDKVDGVKRLHW